jgi:hypothetical protein
MHVRALGGSIIVGISLLIGIIALDMAQELIQMTMRVGLILVLVYITYEAWSGWTHADR